MSHLDDFIITDDNPYSPAECPEGYHDSGGDVTLGPGCATGFTAGFTYAGDRDHASFGDCPIAITNESWLLKVGDPDDAGHRIKCSKLSIADLCEE